MTPDKLNKIDLIRFDKYPQMTVNGLLPRDRLDSSTIKRLEKNKLEIVFGLEKKQNLKLDFSFVNHTKDQIIIVKINGSIHEKISIPSENISIEKSYEFSAKKKNKIVIHFVNSSEINDSYFKCFQISPTNFPIAYTAKTKGIKYVGDPEKNAALARKEYESGKTKLKSFPPVVTFALTTFCNNQIPCLICDRNTRPWNADCETNGFAIDLLTPLFKTAKYILLHCGGEAMFSKYYDFFISRVNPPTKISFATNAMLMNKKRTDLMLEKDIMATIVVSLDASTPETYKFMRPSCDFETVINNIKYYAIRAKQLKRSDAKVRLNMTLCKANIKDAPGLIDMAIKIGAHSVDFNHLNGGLYHKVDTVSEWTFDYIEQSKFDDPTQHDRYILDAYRRAKENGIPMTFVGKPFLDKTIQEKNPNVIAELCGEVPFQTKSKSDSDETIDPSSDKNEDIWSSPYHKEFMRGTPLCMKPWQETVIQPNGDVRMCYFHELSEWCLGNIFEQDFVDIWNSRTFVKERKAFLKNSFADRCKKSTPCVHRNRQ